MKWSKVLLNLRFGANKIFQGFEVNIIPGHQLFGRAFVGTGSFGIAFQAKCLETSKLQLKHSMDHLNVISLNTTFSSIQPVKTSFYSTWSLTGPPRLCNTTAT